MANNGILDKTHFINLVKKNYFLKLEDELPTDLLSKVLQVWSESEKFLRDLKIVKEFGEEKIVITEPNKCFSI